MEGCQRKSIWTEHSTPRSASPLSQPPVFPGLLLANKALKPRCDFPAHYDKIVRVSDQRRFCPLSRSLFGVEYPVKPMHVDVS